MSRIVSPPAIAATAALMILSGCGDEGGGGGRDGGSTGGPALDGGGGDSGSSSGEDASAKGDAGGAGGGDGGSSGGNTGGGNRAPQYAELWYSSGESLVHIALSEQDGSVATLTESRIEGLPIGQSLLTMLDDGSLLGARLSKADFLTHFYYIKDPPRDGSDVEYESLGVMPDDIMLEALYTDCEGRLYGMDTGVDDGGSQGNQLLRFTGDVLASDFAFERVSDLSEAAVADIDDMGPGIDDQGRVTDNPGLAIDTSNIYDFNYETGNGTQVANGGTWGIHALGGPLFDDGVSRIYLLSSTAVLFELDPDNYEVSSPLVTGPTTTGTHSGWAGLTGPLTDCETGFVSAI